MRQALAILDEHGPAVGAAYLSQAVDVVTSHIAVKTQSGSTTIRLANKRT